MIIRFGSRRGRLQCLFRRLKNVKSRETKPGKRSGRNAYTLVEVVIAMLFIALITVSLYGALSGGFAVIQVARENLRATQIMLEWTEDVRLYNWSQLTNAAYLPPAFVQRYDPLGASTNAGGVIYSGTLNLSVPGNVPAAYRNNMRALTVTVYWTNSTRSAKIVRMREMQTYIARYGMQNYVFGQ